MSKYHHFSDGFFIGLCVGVAGAMAGYAVWAWVF